ncbi:hypothetical protein PC118_g24213, partial [Phytophthora cactorum]
MNIGGGLGIPYRVDQELVSVEAIVETLREAFDEATDSRRSHSCKGDFLKLFEWTDGDCGKVMAIKAIDDIVHFTGSRFYVRKEILCVLTNFKNIYQSEFDTGKVVNKQFVLMGSPGTGKSCILALMCFYIAVHHKRPVVWFRQVVGGIYMTTTRLFYE